MTAERKEKPTRKRNIIPMELDDALLKSVEEVSNEIGESKATVMRLAIRAGLSEARAALLKLGKSDPYMRRPVLDPPKETDTDTSLFLNEKAKSGKA